MKEKKDIFICIYELKKTMYSNQTGCFPQVSSLGSKYIMVIHDVHRNSSWAEALKDNTNGELILAQAQALEQMRKAGIVPKHQVLDNQASAAYKKAIGNSDMTYELVPPDNHRCNMAKKPSRHSRTNLLVFSVAVPPLSLCTSGAYFSRR
jgi:hypothetical protein